MSFCYFQIFFDMERIVVGIVKYLKDYVIYKFEVFDVLEFEIEQEQEQEFDIDYLGEVEEGYFEVDEEVE